MIFVYYCLDKIVLSKQHSMTVSVLTFFFVKTMHLFFTFFVNCHFIEKQNKLYVKKIGTELCQAQFKLGLPQCFFELFRFAENG
jgi:hypothetical protein